MAGDMMQPDGQKFVIPRHLYPGELEQAPWFSAQIALDRHHRETDSSVKWLEETTGLVAAPGGAATLRSRELLYSTDKKQSLSVAHDESAEMIDAAEEVD
jgi:hypothetical protein